MAKPHRWAFVVAFILVALIAAPAAAQGQKGCQSLSGSVAAQVNFAENAWMGSGFLSFGTADPLAFSLRDENAGYKDKPNLRMLWGSERLTFTREEGMLVMEVDFIATASPVPFSGTYNATGKITGGTGIFEHASGTVTIHGPFMVAFPPAVEVPFTSWMSEIHGTICGI